MAPCENPQSSTIRVVFTFSRRYISPRGSVGMWMLTRLSQHGGTCAGTTRWALSGRRASVLVGTRGSPALPSAPPEPCPRQGGKEEQGAGTRWSYKEIHGRSAIGKGNLSARKNLVVGKWEQVHTQQFMQRNLTTIWNKYFEFTFKVKLGETANNKKQCRQIKKVLE